MQTKIDLLRDWLTTKNETSLSEIYEWLSSQITNTSKRFDSQLNKHDRDDVLQNVLLHLLKSEFSIAEYPLSVVYHATNWVVRKYRRDQLTRHLTCESDIPADDSVVSGSYVWDGSEVLDREDAKNLIRSGKAQVSRADYRIFRMRLYGHGFKKISDRCGVSVTSAHRRMVRVTDHLAQLAVA